MKILELGIAVVAAVACVSAINSNNIRTDNDPCIIPGIYCGMTTEEVFDVVGTDYSEYADENNPGEMEYYFQLDRVDCLGIDMPAEMFFEFSPKGELFNYGYHIGCVYDVNTNEYSYPYDESQLLEAYETIYDILESTLGSGQETSIASESIKEYSWKSRDNEEIWFMVGTDLWSSGVNEILLSSADESLRN